jgi:hypothetical protein
MKNTADEKRADDRKCSRRWRSFTCDACDECCLLTMNNGPPTGCVLKKCEPDWLALNKNGVKR